MFPLALKPLGFSVFQFQLLQGVPVVVLLKNFLACGLYFGVLVSKILIGVFFEFGSPANIAL